MTHIAMRKHSALCIQSVYRGHLATIRVKKMRNSIKICNWLYGIYISRIRRAISRSTCRYIIRRAMSNLLHSIMMTYNSAVLIQSICRMRIQSRKYKNKLWLQKISTSTINHVMLFGTRRAMLKLCRHLRLQRALYRLLQYYVRMRRLKRYWALKCMHIYIHINTNQIWEL